MPGFRELEKEMKRLWNSRINGRTFQRPAPTTAPPVRAPAAQTDQGAGKFEKALDAVSEIDAQELLKALEECSCTVRKQATENKR